MKLEKAIGLANVAYAGQKDIVGDPLLFHPMRVAMTLDREDERIIAVLSYVLASAITEAMLLTEGFSKHIVNSLSTLVMLEDESMETYVERVKQDNMAKTVLIAILKDRVKTLEIAGLKSNDNLQDSEMMLDLLTMDNHCSLLKQIKNHADVQIAPSYVGEPQIKKFLSNYGMYVGVNLNMEQEDAVRLALQSKVSLIQGVVGTGVVQTLHAICKAIKLFNPHASIGMFSAGTDKERNYLERRVQVNLDVIDYDKIYDYDVVILHALSQWDVQEVEKLLENINPMTRIIFVNDPVQIGNESCVDVEKLSAIPTILLTYGARLAEQNFSNDPNSQTDEQLDENDQEEDEYKAHEPSLFIEKLMNFSEKDIDKVAKEEVESAIEIYEQSRNLTLSDFQKNAVINMFQNRTLVLTGKKGSGLTEAVKGIVECFKLVDSSANFKLYNNDPSLKYLSNRINVPISILGETTYHNDNYLYIVENPELIDQSTLEEFMSIVEDDVNSRILFVANSTSLMSNQKSFDFQTIQDSDKVQVVELLKLHN